MKAHAFTRLLLMLACCFVPAGAGAQILVGLGPSPVIEFTTTPPAAEWATGDIFIIGGAGTYNSPAELDAAAQTVNVSAATMTLPATSGNGTSRFARHNTTGGYLVTQVGSSAAAVLVARLRNTSGLTLELLSISYQYSVVVFPVTDAIPGQRAFWSLTGQPGSWTLIPEFTGVTVSQPLSALLDLGAWTHDTDLYLLWVDANNGTGADGGFAIDNVVFTGGLVTPVNITDQPDDLTVPERGVAVFNVSAPGLPRDYHWLRDGVPIPGAHQSGYTNPFVVYPGDNGAVFSVIVSNYLGSQTSTGAVLTVLPDTNPPVALQVVGDFTRTTATISFSEPIDPATLDASSFQVFPTGTDPQSTGVPATTAIVANATNVVIGFAAEYAADVNHSLLMFDAYDTAHTPHAIDTTILPLHQILRLIDFDGPENVWRFSTETNLFGTGWETAGYDDALWESGPAGLGRDSSANGVPIRTPAYPFNDSAPQFFRRHFYLNADPAGTTLSMRHVFEDGAVVFLNGQEAGRFNVPAGDLSVTTRAASPAGEPTLISTSMPLTTTNLVAGDNVIAVVVFQSGSASIDCEMALELTATIPAYASGSIDCICVPEPLSQVLIEGADVTFSITASGALPITYQWRRNGLPISGATNSSLTLLHVTPNQAGNYDVLLTNSFGHTGSVTATLIVHPADPPMFISALGSVNLTNFILTIQSYMGLDEASAENPAHYIVEFTTGGGALTIESAVLTGSNVVLTTSPRLQGRNYGVTLSGVRDRSVAQNEPFPSTRPVQATVVLFDYNHFWRYDQSGTDLGTSWKEPGYDDSSWPLGAGFLAEETSFFPLTLFTNLAGGSGSNTVLSLTNGTQAGLGGTNITFYFRTTLASLLFDPTAPGNVLRATSYIDDGAAIYVNGLEAMRFNLTNPASYTNFATTNSIEGVDGLITSNLAGFELGSNVIAAEVHQNSISSSDVAWGMRLEALVTTFWPVEPTVLHIARNNGDITLIWNGGGTLQMSTNVSHPAGWQNVPGLPASPFTTSATGAGRFYRVVP
jgi:hypothetical protein